MIECFHLVSLQVPDQVPVNRHINDCRFSQRFLNLVLANIAKSALIRSSHRFRTVRLRDRNDGHLLSVPSALASRLDATPHLGNALAERAKILTAKSSDRESSG
jgi:hypothetical protein